MTPAQLKGDAVVLGAAHLGADRRVCDTCHALFLQQVPAAATAAAEGEASKPHPGAAAGAQQELPFDPFSWQRQRIQLPEVTVAGPVELVLQRPTPLTLFLPHVTDAPPTQRLLVGPGVMLTLQQLRGISLRKPVDLPHLPPAFVAQVRGAAGAAASRQ